jgi:TRAP-type mannitol/chloroaromatic compound transport system permease small subunit
MKAIDIRLERAFEKLVNATNAFAVAVVFAVMIYMTASVIGLFLFRTAVPGAVGFAKVMLPLIVFLSITYTLRNDGHVRTGLLYDRVGRRGKAIIDIVNNALGVAMFVLIAFYGWKFAWAAWVTGDFLDGVLKVPVYPTRFAVFLGSVMIAIEFAIRLCRSLIALARPTYAEAR